MKNLKILRTERGLSQQKLANLLGVTQQSIYKYENGLAEPDFAMLRKMANYFYTSVDYLVGYSEDRSIGSQSALTLENSPMTPLEIKHAILYRHLNDELKKNLDVIIENLSE